MGDICQICELKIDKKGNYPKMHTIYDRLWGKEIEVIIYLHESCLKTTKGEIIIEF